MNRKPLSVAAPKQRKKLRVTLAAALVSLLASNPVHALPSSFPQYPLQTGFAGTVPPNIMLILDDSGSMAWPTMPSNDYDGLITYGNRIENMRYSSNPNPRKDSPAYRSYIHNVIYYNPAVTYKPWRTASPPPSEDRLPQANFKQVSNHVYDLSGSIDLRGKPHAYFYVPKPGISNPGAGPDNYYKYRIANFSGAGSYEGGIVQRCAQSNCTSESEWNNAINETPEFSDKATNTMMRRSQQEELQNIANWFHYHSSRMKMAKAGASEAFGQLDENYRVGYDRINSNKIVYPIPYATKGGLFEGNNRTQLFKYIQDEGGYYNTPTRSSLRRVGEYYKTNGPYDDGKSNLLSCRKNFTVLTTDGSWNQDGNLDRTYPNLASIAKHYYETDLRPDLINNVPPANNPMPDNNNKQHMNLFGISIGLGGTLSDAPDPSKRWPRNPRNDKEKIDDLAYAAGQGRGAFFLANNTDEFAEALLDAFSSMGDRDASATNVAASSNILEAGTLNFGTSFNSKTWIGNMSAFEWKASITPPPPFEKSLKWQLSTTFAAGGVNQHFSQRTVLTHHGSTSPRLFDKNTITDALFGRSSGTAAVSVADNIDYLRGVQSLEKGRGGELRERSHPLGDIVNSTPFYAVDTQTVYVGANDGMLHGLEGNTGKVLFSYVPKGIDAAAMASLSSPKYEHRFFMDGNIDVSSKDIFTSEKNILLAALGRGGRGVFALDVTDPETMSVSNVLWDHSTQDTTSNPNMGYVLSRVRIRPGNHDKTWALVPNGIESPNGKAVLFAYELNEDGSISQTHELVGGNQPNNGLMSLGLVDLDGDSTVDLVYGGDLKGNVWRWDFRTDTPGPASLLFTAEKDQPITGGITATLHPDTGELFIGFGTGRFISEDDLPSEAPSTQSIYGLIDPINTLSIDNTPLVKSSDLQNRTLGTTSTAKINGKDRTVRDFEPSSLLEIGKKGWYMDLSPNERVISDAQMVNGRTMVFPTVIPPKPNESASCESAAGSGFVNMIDLLTGTMPIGVTYASIGTGADTGMPTAPSILCNDNSCKLITCEGDNCVPHLQVYNGPSPASSPVKPHRVQWRSLR